MEKILIIMKVMSWREEEGEKVEEKERKEEEQWE